MERAPVSDLVSVEGGNGDVDLEDMVWKLLVKCCPAAAISEGWQGVASPDRRRTNRSTFVCSCFCMETDR